MKIIPRITQKKNRKSLDGRTMRYKLYAIDKENWTRAEEIFGLGNNY